MHWPSNLGLPKWQLSSADCSYQFHSLSKQATFDCLIGSKYHSTSQWNAADCAEQFVFGKEHSIPRWAGKMQFSSVETSRPCNCSAGKAKLTLSKLLWRCVPKHSSILYFQAIPERTEEWKTQFTLQAGGENSQVSPISGCNKWIIGKQTFMDHNPKFSCSTL